MGRWKQVNWSQASQVAARLGWPAGVLQGDASPEQAFLTLMEQDRLREAAFFLGQALQRRDSVAWAVASVARDQQSVADVPSAGDREALAAAELWVKKPSDNLRRRAFEASRAAGKQRPERLLGLSVFFSGGSIAPPDAKSLQSDCRTCGKLTASAVLLSAHRVEDWRGALRTSLLQGRQVAEFGAEAAIKTL